MTRTEIENEIAYWENEKLRLQECIWDADVEISQLLQEVPDEEEDEF